MYAKIVSLGILKPRGFFGTQNAYVVDSFQAREIIIFKNHAGFLFPT